ncbi:MAG TPA: hypothetical protein VG412_08225 [Acidimicrobiales bacterium]|jgi:hypothetical protein|nr:hypothetical protein [Acidimicrobiales bacterium]
MSEVLEEKLQAVAKVLGEAAESAAEKASKLAEGGGLDLRSGGRGAAVRARRGGEDVAAVVKSQVGTRLREAKSGVQDLIDQKESLAELVPSAADIQDEIKTSVRRLKEEAKREGHRLSGTLDEKTGGRRRKGKAKKKGRRTAVLVVAIAGIGIVLVRFARRNGPGNGQAAHPPTPVSDRTAPVTSDNRPAEEDRPPPEPDTLDGKPAKRASSGAKAGGIKRADDLGPDGSAPDSEKVKRGGPTG